MATDGRASKRKAPEEVADDNIHIPLSIRGLDGRQLFFKVNRDTKLNKVFKNYCDRIHLEYETIRFIYDGHRVKGKQTPKELNMENDDEIFAVRPQTGGGVVQHLTFKGDDMAQ